MEADNTIVFSTSLSQQNQQPQPITVHLEPTDPDFKQDLSLSQSLHKYEVMESVIRTSQSSLLAVIEREEDGEEKTEVEEETEKEVEEKMAGEEKVER
jgi:hypothetical protein